MTRTLTLAAALLLTACGTETPAESASDTPIHGSEGLTANASALLADNLVVPAPEPEPAPEPAAEVAAEVVAAPAEHTLRLRHGESVALVAQWLGVSPEALAQGNDITLGARLDVGYTLIYTTSAATQAKLEAARDAFSADRLAKFLKRRGGLVEVIDQPVRRGQSVWRIARGARLPMWVVAHYNAGRDLNTLAPGDTIKLPVLAQGLTARR